MADSNEKNVKDGKDADHSKLPAGNKKDTRDSDKMKQKGVK
ncbi:hypothetical protein [Pantoea sp. A4]|nr:hypothetical protein [Pantoea sp. A4]